MRYDVSGRHPEFISGSFSDIHLKEILKQAQNKYLQWFTRLAIHPNTQQLFCNVE